MRRLLVLASVLVMTLTATEAIHAAYTIDGDLSDWGVTPFSDWLPNPGVLFELTNNINKYNANGYQEYYDFEALYMASDASKYYIGIVSSYPFSPLHWDGSQFVGGDGGDIFLDVFGTDPISVSPHGVVSGLDYAILVARAVETPGQVVQGTWLDTHYNGGWWPGEGYQGSPHVVNTPVPSGNVLGWATVAIGVHDYGMQAGQWEDDTYIVEIALAKSILPSDIRGIHVTQWCGNDSINLIVPAPGAVLLAWIGTGLAGLLRARSMGRMGRRQVG